MTAPNHPVSAITIGKQYNLFDGPKAQPITAQGNALGYQHPNETSPERAA